MTEQEDRVEALLTEYSEKLPQFERCTKRFRDLLEQVLEAANLGGRIHSVTCRPKDIDRLREKLAGGDRKYSNLSDVTDLIGLRVITYFGEDVDDVASVIEAEFKIDAANSMDKRQALDPDRFGYLSLHYVCNLNEGRAALPEYASLTNLPFEIQVRSILQHAWAEIEHDLGYKTKEAIPVQSQRRFARLAGLLELADDEFRGIRKDLDAYAARVPAEIEQDPAVVRIDKVSLDAFIEHADVARALDQEIAELWGCGL
ncbi:MAG: hypothetical protein IIC90_11175, partial [Chloroflexi bacterium]|nr:hypothetical protein [Chloroflexota bacterium]